MRKMEDEAHWSEYSARCKTSRLLGTVSVEGFWLVRVFNFDNKLHPAYPGPDTDGRQIMYPEDSPSSLVFDAPLDHRSLASQLVSERFLFLSV